MLGRILAKLDALNEGQGELRSDLGSLRSDLGALRVNVDGLRVGMMERMDRLQDSVTAIRDDIGVNMGRADRAHEAADGTRSELRALGEQVSAMARQITHLQVKVREIRGDP